MDESVELVNGHYSMGLPWRYPEVALPNNRSMALKRLSSLKKRLEGDSELHHKYVDTMSDYIDKGYAECIQGEGRTKAVWYLPHHPVLHPQKPGKVRVVFDCAAQWKGHSLNGHLLQGPDLSNSLIGVLLRFREGPIAVAADVESMFHQVRVSTKDCDALRFLWWRDGDITQEPVDHRMLVHLFGATSSPSCAGYALRKTADDNRCNYDNNVIETIHKNFYVDDCPEICGRA
ncbi:hypothetical protein HOLleu_39169 [Holothuria leucospilota]|uniref:Reverse transcriptase domain-containing protein n=1 Tax=Holothuria leucospilota TaxID=206669 RepID=A0A9Q0YI91_HOLLE|nr:hypothetical protein HOLleu_39169 [Holothuria leucospilota]